MLGRSTAVTRDELVSEPKPDGKPFVISKRLVWEAWLRVKANKGAEGVDEESIQAFEANLRGNLYKLWNRMSSGSYMPPPVRAVEIPKKGGRGSRMLGVPTVADRVAQTVARLYLEPEVEPIFHSDSYGYRPGRSALDAVGRCRQRCWRYDWAIDLDLRAFLVPSSHCLPAAAGGVKESVFGLWDQYSQAFSTSAAHVDGLKLVALYTLQHGLAADAHDTHRIDDRNIARRSVLDE